MENSDFEHAFTGMCTALAVQVSNSQAVAFYQHYRYEDAGDFREACDYLARGNPGYLPKQTIFDAAVASAKEMRQAEEARIHRQQADRTFSGIIPSGDGYDGYHPDFGKAALLNVRHLILGDNPKEAHEAKQQLFSMLKDPEWQKYTASIRYIKRALAKAKATVTS